MSTGSLRTDATVASATMRSIPRAAASGELYERTVRRDIVPNLRIRLGDGGERSDRAPDLVDEDSQTIAIGVGHVERSAIRASAQPAASLNTGSSLSTYGSIAVVSSRVPTFPAAMSALRRSQRESLRGT